MSACDLFRPQLSEFIDGTLDANARDRVEGHVATCATCRDIAADLERVRGAARRLGPITPPSHVWDALASAHSQAAPIAPNVSRQERWQWLGLAAALVLVTLGVYAIARPGSDAAIVTTSTDRSNAADQAAVETFEESLGRAEAEYEKAIAQLEQIVKSGDSSMSPTTLATLRKTVGTIDSAIAESRAAVKSDPENQPARTSLFEALRRKVGMLQNTVVLMNEMRKGNEAGAAEAASGLGKKS